jgi:hypothetical protein
VAIETKWPPAPRACKQPKTSCVEAFPPPWAGKSSGSAWGVPAWSGGARTPPGGVLADAVTTPKTGKIQKKLPLGTIANRNLYPGTALVCKAVAAVSVPGGGDLLSLCMVAQAGSLGVASPSNPAVVALSLSPARLHEPGITRMPCSRLVSWIPREAIHKKTGSSERPSIRDDATLGRVP